jgi:mutator protein MutT
VSVTPQLIAIAVVEREDCILIGQRPEGVALAGYWEFPGGKVEAGESPQQAAVRECLEETGVAVDVVGEYPSQTQRYEHGAVYLRFFDCRPRDPAQAPREPFLWKPRKSLAELLFPEGNRMLLERLLQRNST